MSKDKIRRGATLFHSPLHGWLFMWLKKTSTSSWQRERFLESDRIEYVPLGSSTQLAPGISLSTWEMCAQDNQQTAALLSFTEKQTLRTSSWRREKRVTIKNKCSLYLGTSFDNHEISDSPRQSLTSRLGSIKTVQRIVETFSGRVSQTQSSGTTGMCSVLLEVKGAFHFNPTAILTMKRRTNGTLLSYEVLAQRFP